MVDNPWQWLRTHEPESYEQLTGLLRQRVPSLHRTARFVRLWLADVFEWCGEYGIALAELDVSPNLHKYREGIRPGEGGAYGAVHTAKEGIPAGDRPAEPGGQGCGAWAVERAAAHRGDCVRRVRDRTGRPNR